MSIHMSVMYKYVYMYTNIFGKRIFHILRHFKYFVYMSGLPEYMPAHHVCTIFTEARRRNQIPCNWRYG